MDANYQLPVSELNQAGTFFANLGLECPWVGTNAWCRLEEQAIDVTHYGMDGMPIGGNWKKAICPPAVAAAVVDFGQRVIEWMRAQHKAAYMSVEFAPEKMYFWGTHSGAFGRTEDRVEASAALILAVYKAMGGE